MNCCARFQDQERIRRFGNAKAIARIGVPISKEVEEIKRATGPRTRETSANDTPNVAKSDNLEGASTAVAG